MGQPKHRAEQGDVPSALSVPIAHIKANGIAQMAELNPDLMLPARFQPQVNQRRSVPRPQPLIMQPGFLCAGRSFGDDPHQPVLPLKKPVAEVAPGGQVFPFHHGQIFPFHMMGAQLFAEPGGRLAGAGKGHQPAHGPIQPVYQPQIDFPRLLVFFLDVLLAFVLQAQVARLVALGQLTLRFDRHQQVIVLINGLNHGASTGL